MTRLAPGVAVTPEVAGWRYLSFETAVLGAEPLEVGDPRREVAVVVLEGRVTLRIDGTSMDLPGRRDVFGGLPSAASLPGGTSAEATAVGDRAVVALASAPLSGRSGVALDPIRIGPEDVTVEVRGAGNATRQINHIITPDFPADRLEVVEV